MKRKQSGFNLIEIAITAAIISLIFTLTIKGHEMAETSRAKNLAHEFRNIQTALYDHQTPKRSTPIATNIDSKLRFALSDSYILWQQVRQAGIHQGVIHPTTARYVALNATDDSLGDAVTAPISGMTGDYIICSSNIPGQLVKQLDMMMDDGNTATGSMLISGSTYGGKAIASNEIEDSDSYLACLNT